MNVLVVLKIGVCQIIDICTGRYRNERVGAGSLRAGRCPGYDAAGADAGPGRRGEQIADNGMNICFRVCVGDSQRSQGIDGLGGNRRQDGLAIHFINADGEDIGDGQLRCAVIRNRNRHDVCGWTLRLRRSPTDESAAGIDGQTGRTRKN